MTTASPATADPDLPPPGALHVVGAAIVREGLCLVAQRAAHVANAHRWEFPGGKVERGEEPRAALRREILEELGLAIAVGAFLGRGAATLSDGRALALDVYQASLEGGQLALTDHQEIRWIGRAQIAELDWAAADLPLLPALAALLGNEAAS